MKKTVLLSAVVNLTKKEKRQATMPKSTTSMLLPRQEDRPIPAGPEKGPADIHGYDPGLTLVPPQLGDRGAYPFSDWEPGYVSPLPIGPE